MIVGTIGSRDLTAGELEGCRDLGTALAEAGHRIRTGNAVGADQAFAAGANKIYRRLVTLCLPWWGYERAAVSHGNDVLCLAYHDDCDRLYAEAERLHPAWDRCSRGARALHARNGLIVDHCDIVLAWPRRGADPGGTGQGMRVSRDRGVELVDLGALDHDGWDRLYERLGPA